MHRPLAVLTLLSCGAIGCGFPHAVAAPAASARSLVTITRPVVELKDLFRNAGPKADAALGPGPAPGQRITVGAQQLAAIATQYGVAWSPADPQVDVVIERQGIPLTRAQLTDALRPALARAGAPRHFALTIDDRHLPMIAPGLNPDIAVNQVTIDRSSGAFSAALLLKSATTPAIGMNISGIVTPAIRAVVAARNLIPGQTLSAADVKLAWIPDQDRPRALLTSLSQAVGMEVNRAFTRATPLNADAVITPLLIARGAMVSLAVDMPGLEVTARGIALAAGGAGSVIAVMNPTSREIVQAIVDGPDRAHVVPGSMPARPRTANPYYNLGMPAQ